MSNVVAGVLQGSAQVGIAAAIQYRAEVLTCTVVFQVAVVTSTAETPQSCGQPPQGFHYHFAPEASLPNRRRYPHGNHSRLPALPHGRMGLAHPRTYLPLQTPLPQHWQIFHAKRSRLRRSLIVRRRVSPPGEGRTHRRRMRRGQEVHGARHDPRSGDILGPASAAISASSVSGTPLSRIISDLWENVVSAATRHPLGQNDGRRVRLAVSVETAGWHP
jgi:hypothetical protein